MNKNIHSAEMHRLADAPQGTEVWQRAMHMTSWLIDDTPRWLDGFHYIIDDEWQEIRKAIVDGKTIEVKTTPTDWMIVHNIANDINGNDYALSKYRIKPDVVEPTYYYQYEKLDAGEICTLRHVSDTVARKELHCTEANGWFKIESSKRTWEH